MSLLRQWIEALRPRPAPAGAEEPWRGTGEVLEAAEWIAAALAQSGYRADFSLASLKELDRFFDEHSVRGAPKPGGLLAESTASRLFALGCYVGEVLRRRRGGRWRGSAEAQDVFDFALEFGGDTVWPMQRVLKRFRHGREDGLYVYGALLLRDTGLRSRIGRWYGRWRRAE
jgi:hypothetical protein